MPQMNLPTISGDGNGMDTANTKDATIVGVELATPNAPQKKADTSTPAVSQASVSDAVTTKQEPPASRATKSKQDWTPAEAATILWQSRKNALDAGVDIPVRQVFDTDGTPIIILNLRGMVVCGNCGRWNYGLICVKCGYETQKPQLPQGDTYK